VLTVDWKLEHSFFFFQALEACVVRLDVSRLDLNQLLPLCWLHGLYDAIIYMYTRGMADYTGPLQELLPTLQSALATDSISF